LDKAITSSTRQSPAAVTWGGPADHPMLDIPFHVEIDGRQYKGREISLVRATISGLIDPHMQGLERLAWVVFRFQGYTVGLSIEVRVEDVDAAKGAAALVFLEPMGEHLPQLRHLMNSYIAGDLVTLGTVLTVRPSTGTKPKGAPAPARRLRRFGGTLLMLALTALLLGLVATKVFQRVFTYRLATPAVVGFDGRTLAATATGQIDFLDPEAKAGDVAYAIRSNTGQALSVVMPCDCRVEVLGVEAGSTVFAGDPVLRVSDPDAPLVLTGTVLPEETLDLAQASAVDLRFADGQEVTAHLAPGGLGSAAPGEPVPFRLTPDQPLAEDLAGQMAEVTLRRPVPDLARQVTGYAQSLTSEAKAVAP
jgi:alginate biosynthesis protein Alg44